METQIFFLSHSSFFPLITISFSMNLLLLGIMLNPLGETKIKKKKEKKTWKNILSLKKLTIL